MSLSSAAPNYRRVGPGQLYLLPAPTTDPGLAVLTPTILTCDPLATTQQLGSVDGYYAMFFGTAAAPLGLVAKQTLLNTIKAWGNGDSTGLDLKIKMQKAKFDSNIGPAVEVVTGIETASADITIFDVDPPHLVDMFGSQAADLLTCVAATGVAARNIALLGPQSYNTQFTALYRFPSLVTPGSYVHWLFPNVLASTDIEIKMSKKDEMKLKVSLQLMCSPWLLNSQGMGVVVITDDPNAPAI
jgi:hypothetical protein